MKTGVIIMRCQVHKLHEGHKHIIEYAMSNSDQVIILLGISDRDRLSSRNPLEFQQRQIMIMKAYSSVRVQPLMDIENNDKKWSKSVDYAVEWAENVTLYHSRDSFKDYYSGNLPTVEVKQLEEYSGTKTREDVDIKYTEDFRAGIIYAINKLKI